MNILQIAMLIFIIIESANVCILYFVPETRFGNGIAVFDAWNDTKSDENLHLFARYMTYWVAGTKLIFIVLLLVILLVGNEQTQFFGVIAMILSIATYFWKLHPIIKTLDINGKITPKGYSKALFSMIAGFLTMFSGAFIVHFLQ